MESRVSVCYIEKLNYFIVLFITFILYVTLAISFVIIVISGSVDRGAREQSENIIIK